MTCSTTSLRAAAARWMMSRRAAQAAPLASMKPKISREEGMRPSSPTLIWTLSDTPRRNSALSSTADRVARAREEVKMGSR